MQTLLSWTPINGVWLKCLPLLEKTASHSLESASPIPGPEEVVRRIRNNSGIDEGMISKLRIIIFPEGAVGIVDDTDGSHGRAVGWQRSGR